jgi:predicted translin family RNA/ssDNA-binding protein
MKTCETVLYELSVTDSTNSAEDLDNGLAGDRPEERASKKLKVDVLSNESMGNGIMPMDELESIKKRMEHRDELRENLIKRCRDGQKVAKQAIFALHRGDRKQSLRLIKECEKCILHDLLPIVNEEPQLRMGSFGGVVEEYVEAKLFYCWLYGKEDGDNSMNGNNHEKPSGIILKHVDFPLELEADEYLGGLCDFTGEVGRYAVQRGTSRDSNAVQFCLETNLSIQYALEMLHRFPSYGNIGKKMEPLRRSVEKLQRMLYELSLVQATGRQIVADSVNNIEGERGDKD